MSVGKQFGNIEYRCCTKYVVLANRCSKNFDIKNMSKVKPDTKQNDLPFLPWTDTWKFQRGEFQNVVLPELCKRGLCLLFCLSKQSLIDFSIPYSYYGHYFNLQNIFQKKPFNNTYYMFFFQYRKSKNIFIWMASLKFGSSSAMTLIPY